MGNLDTVRLFVIDSLKKYHAALTDANEYAMATTLQDYTPLASYNALKEQVEGLVTTDGEPNKIDHITVNGSEITPDASKTVAISYYTTLSQMTNDNNTVTDANYVHTDNNFTSAYMSKLDAIEAGAEVNVNSDWNAASGDAQILNKPDIASLFGYAYYDSSNHKISFSYSSGSSELYNIDCADFIVDGMVHDVRIATPTEGTNAGKPCLVIDFNSDAENTGLTDIEIPLTGIFDPNNYYDKTQIDTEFESYNGRVSTLETAYTYFTTAYNTTLTRLAANEQSTSSALEALDGRVDTLEEHELSLASNTPAAASTGEANVVSSLAVNGHEITATYTKVLTSFTETDLSLGSGSGEGNVISSLSVNGHEITATYTQVLTADSQEAISLSGSKPSAQTNRTAVVTDITASGTKNHILTVTYANVVTSETQLSMSGSAPAAAGSGKAKVISQLTVNDHAITATYTEVLTEHQSLNDYLTHADAASTYLSKADAASTYVVKEAGKGLSTNDFTNAYMTKLDGIEAGAEVNAIETITVNGGNALAIDGNRNVDITIPASPTLSLSGTKAADAGDFTYVANTFAVNDHAITVTYTGVLKQHQDISGKEDVANKKTAIAANATSDSYYPSISAVASYVGSLEELTSSELNDIFGISNG